MSTPVPPIHQVPAAHLEGRELDDGWQVLERIERPIGASGGHFSVSYRVVDGDGREAFLKALNFHAASSSSSSVTGASGSARSDEGLSHRS